MDVSVSTWHTLSKLLDEALDLEPGARAAWLEQLTVTQPVLAPSVRKLLAAHASSETVDVLAQLPALPMHLDAARINALSPGDRVGAYRLKRELGTGGMADVWLAERADGAFARDVALKIPLVSRLRRDLAQRFARERDILARLEHPHIARLYDGGVSGDGVPHLAMEYVDGQPITEYCDATQLDTAARLKLFLQVLEAVQYAHANLIIHRDLKPSNILVTADGQVRLLDFGIAKLLADDDTARETQLTQMAGRALTPDYASPEQVRGEPLTIATDIYSLGVVLYELLAGSRPYKLKMQSAAHLEQAIVDAEPNRPSSVVDNVAARARGTSQSRLARALAGDLDTIVLKSLAKAPKQRYTTAAGFAADVQRHLDGQPVSARPAAWTYRFRKFIARNKLAVTAASAMGIVLVVASVVSLQQAQTAREQAARADEVKKFVLSIFENADIDGGGSRKMTAVDLLSEARKRLEAAPVSDPTITVELLTSIGYGLVGLGEYAQATPMLEKAVELAAAHLDEVHPNRLAAELVYAESLLMSSQHKRAAPFLDAAEKGLRRSGDVAGLVNALRWKSSLLLSQGRPAEAMLLATEAVELTRSHSATIPKQLVVRANFQLAYAMVTASHPDRLEFSRSTYEMARELLGDRVNSMLLSTRQLYAYALLDEGNIEQGIIEIRAVLQQQSELLGETHGNLKASHDRLGRAAIWRGEPLAAMESFKEALRIELASSSGRSTPGVGLQHLNLGIAQGSAGRHDIAEIEVRRANEIFAATLDPGHRVARLGQIQLASLLIRAGRLDEADSILARLPKAISSRPFEAERINVILGELKSAQGRHSEAQLLLKDAVQGLSKDSLPVSHARALATLGAAQLKASKYVEALNTLQQAEAAYAKFQPRMSPDRAELLVDLARTQIELGDSKRALAAAEQAAEFWSSFDRTTRSAGIALLWHARALAAAGDRKRAIQIADDAASVLKRQGLPIDATLLADTQRQVRMQARPPRD